MDNGEDWGLDTTILTKKSTFLELCVFQAERCFSWALKHNFINLSMYAIKKFTQYLLLDTLNYSFCFIFSVPIKMKGIFWKITWGLLPRSHAIIMYFICYPASARPFFKKENKKKHFRCIRSCVINAVNYFKFFSIHHAHLIQIFYLSPHFKIYFSTHNCNNNNSTNNDHWKAMGSERIYSLKSVLLLCAMWFN